MEDLRSHAKACGLHPKAVESIQQVFIEQLPCVKSGLCIGDMEGSKSDLCPHGLHNFLQQTDMNPKITEQMNA